MTRMRSGQAAADLLQGLLSASPGLTTAHLQLADRCNHSCVHCYQVQGQKGELSPEDALRVVDRLADAGVFLLTISGGEATLRHDLVDVIARARSRAMAVTLFTNGYTMTRELAHGLAELAVWRVHISVYGPDAATHDAVTNVRGSFERTIAGVKMLRDEGVHVVLKTPVMHVNHDRIEAIRDLARELGCSVGLSEEITAREDGDLSPVALNATGDEHAKYLEVERRRSDYTPEALAAARRGRTCSVGRVGVTIEPNGELRPCTALVAPLGNVLRDDPASLFDGEANAFIQNVSVATLHGCRDCDLITGCQRCHGNAAHEVGDAFAPYPSACRRALGAYRRAVGGVHVIESPERPADVGPFRIVSEGVVEQIPDVRTTHDEEIARRYPWIRPDADYAQRMLSAPSGERLVQLRSSRTRRSNGERRDER